MMSLKDSKIGGESVSDGATLAMVDSGTSCITMPNAEYKKFAAAYQDGKKPSISVCLVWWEGRPRFSFILPGGYVTPPEVVLRKWF